MLRIVIPTIYSYFVQEIDPGGKRCLCIRAGLNRREVSGIVAGGEGVGELPGQVSSSMYRGRHKLKKSCPKVGITIPLLERTS
jgi:hypothetical protein